jgi:hypothetical protein
VNVGALVFVGAFAVSSVLGLFASGCSFGDCDCPENPDQPTPQAPLGGLDVVGYDGSGGPAPLEVAPEQGTLEVRADAVVIEYLQAGVRHQVTYEVTPHSLRAVVPLSPSRYSGCRAPRTKAPLAFAWPLAPRCATVGS